MYIEHKNLIKKYGEKQEELLKYRNHYRGDPAANKNPQDRKIKLSDIEFDEEKLTNLLSAMQNRKPEKRRYYNDVYSDDGTESENEFSENDDESSDEEFAKKKNKTQARKGTVARTTTMTTEPAIKKEEKAQKRMIDYINR